MRHLHFILLAFLATSGAVIAQVDRPDLPTERPTRRMIVQKINEFFDEELAAESVNAENDRLHTHFIGKTVGEVVDFIHARQLVHPAVGVVRLDYRYLTLSFGFPFQRDGRIIYQIYEYVFHLKGGRVVLVGVDERDE